MMIMTANGMTAILVPAHVPGFDAEDLTSSFTIAAASCGAQLKDQEVANGRRILGFAPGGPDVEAALCQMARQMGIQ